jgi:hypothetical protein
MGQRAEAAARESLESKRGKSDLKAVSAAIWYFFDELIYRH